MDRKGLTKLAEEAGELAQIAAKKSAFLRVNTHPDGNGPMDTRLENEMGDLIGATAYVIEKLGLDEEHIRLRAQTKLAKFKEWDGIGEDYYRVQSIEDFGYEELFFSENYPEVAVKILEWLDVKSHLELVSILPRGPEDMEEIYSLEPYFRSVIVFSNVVVGNLFVGEVSLGYYDYRGLLCRSVAFCHGGPFQFLVEQELLE